MPALRQYQKDAVQFIAKRHGRALVALPPGAGKTAIVSSWIAGSTGPILVIAPNGPVLDHWSYELAAWGGLSGVVGTGTKKQREHHRTHLLPGEVLILNYECMRNDIDALVDIPWGLVIFDESHRLKGRKLTFKCAAKLAKAAPSCILVTGTPVLNRAEELWTSLHLIDPTKYRSYWRWVEAHFQINYPRYRRRIVREVGNLLTGHVEIVRQEIGDRMFYRPLKDILPDLPPVTETDYEVYLSTSERKHYDDMLEQFWMEVGGEIVQAVNTVAQQTRLRQLASDWSTFGMGPGTKAKAAAGLVEDLDGAQCIIFCAFRDTAEAVSSIIPDSAAYHGGITAEHRSRLVEAFRVGEIQVLVATIATMGEGVDGLQGCHNVIMLDRLWTPARNEQAIGRCHRLGQKSSVNVMHLVAEDTIDDTILQALHDKTSVIDAVIKERTRAVH
jgi:SNF2 family DNA or RNA helicase